MKRWVYIVGLLAGLGAALLGGCDDDPDYEAAFRVPGTTQPANFPAMRYTPAMNPPTQATFELGRKLFYDARLSRDGSISCASCHRQAAAFSDGGQALSRGVAGQLGTRNSPALQNLRWKPSFMWDGGAVHIENQPLAPFLNPLEMGTTLPDLLAKLNADADYKQQFAAVYGPGPIESYHLLRALAQFTAALSSSDSRYDKYVRQEPGGTLDAAERRGLALVQSRCASCHATDLFTDETFRNNGLDRSFPRDSGRAHISAVQADVGLFKVPSLRNVALTAPYMHDGRFATLEEVLNHYSQGVQPSPTLDPLLQPATGPLGIPLTAQEQQDIIAFLRTLTDQRFISDPLLAGR